MLGQKLKSAKQAHDYINDFFILCDREKWIPTLSRLADYLGMTREQLSKYGSGAIPNRDTEGIANEIMLARSRVEMLYEDLLLTRSNVGGVTFALKNNFGWADKIETKADNTGTIEISWGASQPAPGIVNVTPTIVAAPAAPLCVDVAATNEEDSADPLDTLFDD